MTLKGLVVSDLMTTALMTLRGRDSVSRADFDMKLARIRHLPIVDEKQRLIGIVSNRDILRALGGGKQESVAIAKIMTTTPITVTPEQPAHEAAGLMLEHKIGALPVVGDEGELVGLVTETEFLEVAHRALSQQGR